MTFHSQINYKCPSCELPFVPFKPETQCPKCDDIVNDSFPMIEETVNAIEYHGFQPPQAYAITSTGDSYISMATVALMRMPKDAEPMEFAREFASKGLPSEQLFLEDHVAEFLGEVLTQVSEGKRRISNAPFN